MFLIHFKIGFSNKKNTYIYIYIYTHKRSKYDKMLTVKVHDGHMAVYYNNVSKFLSI